MTAQTVVAARPSALAPGGFLRRAARKPLGVISAAYLVLLTLACVLAPVIAPYPPLAQDLSHVEAGPSAAHLLGTDELGRDVLSRLLYGGQVTLLGVVECVAVLLIISLPSGLAAGYLGGWVDRVTSAVVDLMLSVPAHHRGARGARGVRLIDDGGDDHPRRPGLGRGHPGCPQRRAVGARGTVRGGGPDLRRDRTADRRPARAAPHRGPGDRAGLAVRRDRASDADRPGVPRPGNPAARAELGRDGRRGLEPHQPGRLAAGTERRRDRADHPRVRPAGRRGTRRDRGRLVRDGADQGRDGDADADAAGGSVPACRRASPPGRPASSPCGT